jgi:hypothetical protein
VERIREHRWVVSNFGISRLPTVRMTDRDAPGQFFFFFFFLETRGVFVSSAAAAFATIDRFAKNERPCGLRTSFLQGSGIAAEWVGSQTLAQLHFVNVVSMPSHIFLVS